MGIKLKSTLLGFLLPLLIAVPFYSPEAPAVVTNQATSTTTGYGNGTNVDFTITFDFRNNSWITVTQYDTSTSPTTVTQIPQGYGPGYFQVSGGTPGTTVVMGTPPTSTQFLIISRNIPLTQPVVFNAGSIFPYKGISSQLDAMTLMIQNLGADLNQAIGASSIIPSGAYVQNYVQNASTGTFYIIGTGSSSTATTTLNNFPSLTYNAATGALNATASNATLATTATAATALAATPSQCTGSEFATGITANGTANCSTFAGSGAGGSTTQVQYNSGGLLAGVSTFTLGASTLTVPGLVSSNLSAGPVLSNSLGQLYNALVSLTSNVSGTLQAAQVPAFTGDVTTPGGSLTTTIGAGAVTLTKQANLAANSIQGNNTGSPATPLALTATQATAMLNLFSPSLQGLVPASSGGTTTFLRADGSFAVPPAGATYAAPTQQIFTSTVPGPQQPYWFNISGGASTVPGGATFISNGHTCTVIQAESAALYIAMTCTGAPSASGLLTCSSNCTGSIPFFSATPMGTYTAPSTAALDIVIDEIGGGGGGGAGGGGGGTAATNGQSAVFLNSSVLLLALPGTFGAYEGNGGLGGGWAASSFWYPGGYSTCQGFWGTGGQGAGSNSGGQGGAGGGSPRGGGGAGSGYTGTGNGFPAGANSGGGGAGAPGSANGSYNSGAGGGGGGELQCQINSPGAGSLWYYIVPKGGAGGVGNVSNNFGGAGGTGYDWVKENYQ